MLYYCGFLPPCLLVWVWCLFQMATIQRGICLSLGHPLSTFNSVAEVEGTHDCYLTNFFFLTESVGVMCNVACCDILWSHLMMWFLKRQCVLWPGCYIQQKWDKPNNAFLSQWLTIHSFCNAEAPALEPALKSCWSVRNAHSGCLCTFRTLQCLERLCVTLFQ